MNRIIRGARLGGLIVLVTFGAACRQGGTGHGSAPAAGDTVRVSGIRVATVSARHVPRVREFAGSVRARTVSRISARLMAQVIDVSVREGDRVKAGTRLLRLDDRELKTRLRQAESALGQARAGLALAEATLRRYRTLRDEKAVSPQEYDTVASKEAMARQAVSQAESAVAEAQTFLDFAEIVSPVDGVLVERRIDPGSMVTPGMPLLVLEPEGRYQVEVPVDMSVADHVKPGTLIDVSVDAAAFRASVPVRDVVPRVDAASRTVRVKADLPLAAHGGAALRSGQFARVRVEVGTDEAIVVPEAAVIERGQLDGVFVVHPETGRLRFRIVRMGGFVEDAYRTVLSGLQSGERVVVEGADRAGDGLRVDPPAGGGGT